MKQFQVQWLREGQILGERTLKAETLWKLVAHKTFVIQALPPRFEHPPEADELRIRELV